MRFLLTIEKRTILEVLSKGEEMTVSAIARKVGLSIPRANALCTQLERGKKIAFKEVEMPNKVRQKVYYIL